MAVENKKFLFKNYETLYSGGFRVLDYESKVQNALNKIALQNSVGKLKIHVLIVFT